jgi:aspartyl-tRNA(Asn)/glutamyl-tRNA(Gln) amidotransferase subunit A
LQTHSAQYDPRVLTRIQRGASMSAREYFDLHTQRKSWITRVESALQAYDAVLSPTVPIVAPPMAEVAPGPERDAAFFSANAQLLRNTSVVNMLDGCAISIPCHEPEDLPVGLMIWAPALKDDKVLNIAHQAEASLAQSMS